VIAENQGQTPIFGARQRAVSARRSSSFPEGARHRGAQPAVALHTGLDRSACRVLANGMKVRIDTVDTLLRTDGGASCCHRERQDDDTLQLESPGIAFPAMERFVGLDRRTTAGNG
jgi:hypothetical protein